MKNRITNWAKGTQPLLITDESPEFCHELFKKEGIDDHVFIYVLTMDGMTIIRRVDPDLNLSRYIRNTIDSCGLFGVCKLPMLGFLSSRKGAIRNIVARHSANKGVKMSVEDRGDQLFIHQDWAERSYFSKNERDDWRLFQEQVGLIVRKSERKDENDVNLKLEL